MIAVFGAGGCAKELDWLISDLNAVNGEQIHIDVFVTRGSPEKRFLNTLLEDETEFFSKNRDRADLKIFMALGDCFLREKVYNNIVSGLGGEVVFPNVIHPSVKLDTRKCRFVLGVGNLLCAGSIIMPDVTIGNFNYISLQSIIGHDTTIGNFVTIFPGVRIAGHVAIGNKVLIGTGSIIIENIQVCSNVVIGAGSVVTKDIDEPGTYVGIPAKKIK